jgi:nucleotide-binding universal stress UspA family protein
MSNYNRVLIPIDSVPGTGALTPAVRRIVDTSDAEITLLHVVESQPWLGRNGHTLRLMSELDLFAHRQFRGARIARRIEWGRPADCILNVIRTARMDAVWMSAGHAPPDGSALGLVAAEVLAEAPCPVLLEWGVTAHVKRARTRPVCCAIEFDGSEEAVLQEAVWVAARMDAPLKAMCALEPFGSQAALLWDPAEREREVAGVRSRMEGLCERWAPRAEVHVGVGLPGTVFSRVIRFHGARMLVSGGSREALLAAESQCPVLYIGPSSRVPAGRPEAAGQAEFAAARCA